jgi:hypothetical protein
MEILRVQPYGAISVPFLVPAGYDAETEFSVQITDMADLSITETTSMAESGDTITIALPGIYDNSYRVIVSDGENNLLDDTYDTVRPYVDPASMSDKPSEISDYTRHEELARAIIDSIVPEGFYYKKKVLDVSGNGSDSLPVWEDVKKIVAVYENNVALDSTTFELTKDKSAIIQKYTEIFNRSQSPDLVIPLAMSDSVDFMYPDLRGFPATWDYRITVEHGYTSVPSDITRAAKLLIEDITCGKLEYYKRYMAEYNTDQFRLKFDSRVFEGTGNIIVDKILSKYTKSIKFMGVL